MRFLEMFCQVLWKKDSKIIKENIEKLKKDKVESILNEVQKLLDKKKKEKEKCKKEWLLLWKHLLFDGEIARRKSLLYIFLAEDEKRYCIFWDSGIWKNCPIQRDFEKLSR